MKAEDLIRELKKGIVKPVYYLYGNEDFLKNESFSMLKTIVLSGAVQDFNYDLYYGGEVEAAKILASASTLPVMAARRLVVVKGAEKLKGPDEEILLPYIENPSPSTSLVFFGRDVDRRKKFFTVLNKTDALVEHNRPYENEMPRWIKWVAGKRGVEITERACRYLVDIIGNDLGSISNEIQKASLYVGDKKRIDLEDVEALTTDVKARTIFELVDAVGNKNLPASLKNLKKLLDGGESPLLVIAMLVRQARLLWTGLEILNKGGNEQEIRKTIKLPPFVFKGYMRQLKLFSEEELNKVFERLFELDLKFKSSRIDKEKALELFFFELCRG